MPGSLYLYKSNCKAVEICVFSARVYISGQRSVIQNKKIRRRIFSKTSAKVILFLFG
jgi:hypothetical protein